MTSWAGYLPRLSALCAALLLATAGRADGRSPTADVTIGTPLRLCASVGVSGVPWAVPFGDNSGPSLRAEAGLDGGRLMLGYRTALSLGFLQVAAAEVSASVMRSWDDALQGIPPGCTYAGLEARSRLRLLVVRGGLYRRLAGGDAPGWVVSAGIGVGI